MAAELSQNLIQHLIEIGASGRFEDGEKIPSLFPSARSGSFMRLAPHSWCAVALFRKLSERSHDDLTPVIDWVLGHTDNPYLPFGSHNLGVRSLEELHALSARAAEPAEARHTTEENREREAKIRKAALATHSLFGALRRHDEKAVVALLSRGADIYASNELGQSAFEYARSMGLQHLMTPSANPAVHTDTAR